jgi:signal transduction histidine kinase
MNESTTERPVFLSTLPAGPSERRLALVVMLVSIAIFVAVAPFAKVLLAPVPPFIPSLATALIINDLITAVLLFGQFAFLRSRALLVLACGYLFTALITVSHALTFPGAFAPAGLLGAGQHTTAWLYVFWHAGFPLIVIAYALLKNPRAEKNSLPGRIGVAILGGIAAVLVTVGGFTLLATAGHDWLPAMMQANHIAPQGHVILTGTWLLSLLALAVLWRRRPHTVLDLWLMVVLGAWVFDIALSAVLNAGRFDVGFYGGRIYGLMAASFVLLMLLIENSALYARLVTAHESERHKAAELAATNQELKTFSYSVSHDLRAPLRSIDGFSSILLADYGDRLDATAKDYLQRVATGCQRMGHLIDDLLALTHVIRHEMRWEPIDLSNMADAIADQLTRTERNRKVTFVIAAGMRAKGDPGLLRIVLENLLGNAWKFTRRTTDARIEVSVAQQDGERAFRVGDNGAGFDMTYVEKLFSPFQRLHDAAEFPGTGIGLATVQRVIHRHGGRIWAEGTIDRGAAFYFTLREVT